MSPLIVQDDVRVMAQHFGLDPVLVQAVVNAEGDIVKAVACSIPSVTTRSQALDVLCRSCAHALNDYVRQQDPTGFIAFWANRWAPVGVANDPQGLNQFWAGNVSAGWLQT